MKRLFANVLALIVAATLAGCAGMGGGGSSDQEIRQGRIEQIQMVQVDHPNQFGVGAILGGGAGAALGSLIGAGTGRDVAIAVGAIAGAVGGSYAQSKYDSRRPAQQVIVRLTSGVLVSITQQPNPALYVGQNVYVEGAGANASIVPR